MPTIVLVTVIKAPRLKVFDLSRSIDLHMQSTARTKEKAIAGVTSGLIGLHQSVTWRARHFLIWWKLSVEIVEMESPYFFVDQMKQGIFKSMMHRHTFAMEGENTIMTDHFNFESPGGVLGKVFNFLILRSYLTSFLLERNAMIKLFAETQ